MQVRPSELRQAGREALGVTTDYALAAALDVHPSSLSQLMTGSREPSAMFITAVLETLGRSFEELFEVTVDELVPEAA